MAAITMACRRGAGGEARTPDPLLGKLGGLHSRPWKQRASRFGGRGPRAMSSFAYKSSFHLTSYVRVCVP